MLPAAVEFLAKPFRLKAPPQPPPEQPKPVEPPVDAATSVDPQARRIIHDFFQSQYWPYVREILNREIIVFQMNTDKQLQGALADPRDVNGKLAAYFGGKIKAGDEIKLILERLKKNYSQ